MSETLLVPVHVEAKVIQADVRVPALAGAPFITDDKNTLLLEKGVHLHWALPDALTRAQTEADGQKSRALFPAVPDLWLVVRYNPAPSMTAGATAANTAAPVTVKPSTTSSTTMSAAPSTGIKPSSSTVATATRSSVATSSLSNTSTSGVPKRGFKAWVVDSRNGTSVALNDFLPPAASSGQVFTVRGLMEVAPDHPGWGEGTGAPATPERIEKAAYYPSSRKFFGFYDPVFTDGDVYDKTQGKWKGPITYLVVGWYANRDGDPLYRASDQEALLKRWKLRRHLNRITTKDLPAKLVANASTPSELKGWVPPSLESLKQGKPTIDLKAIQKQLPVASSQSVSQETFMKQSMKISTSASVQKASTSAAVLSSSVQGMAQVTQSSTGSTSSLTTNQNPAARLVVRGPQELVCHGAVIDVSPDKAQSMAPAAGRIGLYPTLKRAMAAVAAGPGASESRIDDLEALLQDVDHQTQTLAGTLDVPAATHALTFQSVPGNATVYGRVRIFDRGDVETVAAMPSWMSSVPMSTSSSSTATPSAQAATASTTPVRREPTPTGSAATGPRQPLEVGQYTTTTYHVQSKWPGPEIAGEIQNALKLSLIRDQSNYFGSPPSPSGSATVQSVKTLQAAAEDLKRDLLAQLETSLWASTGRVPSRRYIWVQDRRDNPRPPGLDVNFTLEAPSGTAWWLDLEEPADVQFLLQALKGDRLAVPHPSEAYRKAGPRWYRPWSPCVVLEDIGRTYRFGHDGRFEPDGFVQCRLADEVVTGIRAELTSSQGVISSAPARDLADLSALSPSKGLPAASRFLAGEVLLLDPVSSPALANLWLERCPSPKPSQPPEQTFSHLISLALNRSRLNLMAVPLKETVDLLSDSFEGLLPSPLAYQAWRDPWLPLFADVDYKYQPFPVRSNWTWDSVEMQGPAGSGTHTLAFAERCLLGATIPTVLESAMVSRQVADFRGMMRRAWPPPQSSEGTLSSSDFLNRDLVSGQLTRFDKDLFQRLTLSQRGDATVEYERAGKLTLNKVKIIDCFGTVTERTPGGDAAQAGGTVDLYPRLPCWARLQFRLMSAANDSEEAAFGDSPVAGYLVPEFVEHALEVFSPTGEALGQLVGLSPIKYDKVTGTWSGCDGEEVPDWDAKSPTVWFKPHPWVVTRLWEDNAAASAATKSSVFGAGVAAAETATAPQQVPNADDPTGTAFLQDYLARYYPGNECRHLLLLVKGITSQSTRLSNTNGFKETALSALIRAVDTMRVAIDQKIPLNETQVRIIGQPIAILRAKMWLEAVDPNAKISELASKAPGDGSVGTLALKRHPGIPVQVGSLVQPDDGVIGCFESSSSEPVKSRFHLVSGAVADGAVASSTIAVSGEDGTIMGAIEPVKQDFVCGNDAPLISRFTLGFGEQKYLTLLTDISGGIYLTCGVLPRKKITLPREFLEGATRRLAPTYHVGPILAQPTSASPKPMLPAPEVEGYKNLFVLDGDLVTKTVRGNEAVEWYPEDAIPPMPPLGEVPSQRCVYVDGWVRLKREEKDPTAERSTQ